MTLHNPANLDPSLVGPNHKLLSTEDLSKPLPEGAEYWCTTKAKWYLYEDNLTCPYVGHTYRIPLTLSDRLKAERERLDEQIRVVEAVEQGKEWQHDNGLDWHTPDKQDVANLHEFIKYGRLIRLKPTPQTIPWTLESHPDVVCVVSKTDLSEHYSVTRWRPNSAWIDGKGWLTYDVLHSDWLQRNGDAAGQEVEG